MRRVTSKFDLLVIEWIVPSAIAVHPAAVLRFALFFWIPRRDCNLDSLVSPRYGQPMYGSMAHV